MSTTPLQAPATAFALPTTASAGAVATAPAKPLVLPNCPAPRRGEATCFSLRRADIAGQTGVLTNEAPRGFGPSDLLGAYGLPANGGDGATIAIVVAFDAPNAEADLAVYRQQFGLPECSTANGCFRKLNQNGEEGNYPAPDEGWAIEAALDLDMVSAIAPKARILLVEATTNGMEDLGTAVNQAAAQGARYVSNSWGLPYTSTPGSGEHPTERQWSEAYFNHPGIAVVASAGNSHYGVSYPAASQYVTSVGGTSLARESSARGWSESAWSNVSGGTGSGCSVYEPKPAFQRDTGCGMRAVGDVSAVADPYTGVAVYSTHTRGWTVLGGTSTASPIIASTYALAGTPADGTMPNAYPYTDATGLNDMTTGSNGTCEVTYLCTAGPGYDGPTGLGTPRGLTAFRAGPHGRLAGRVTDAATGKPIAGARVSVGRTDLVTDLEGRYDAPVAAGRYDLAASMYGYETKTVNGVDVPDGQTVTQDFALAAMPTVTVSGTVRDDSGHGWPLYASVAINGAPGAPVYTDPYTGRYTLKLPARSTYTMRVLAEYPGYQPASQQFTVGEGDLRQDIGVKIDESTCDAAGYAESIAGGLERFDGLTAPTGWTVRNNTPDGGWEFDGAKLGLPNVVGDGNFAFSNSGYQVSRNLDTELISPVVNLSGKAKPRVEFDTYFATNSQAVADVDLSLDGGRTWTTVWHRQEVGEVWHHEVPLPQAANQPAAQVRFHHIARGEQFWLLDNVAFGDRSCDVVPGGLIAGQVTDGNTSAPLNDATVTSDERPAERGMSKANPSDPKLANGFYSMFSSLAGGHRFTGTRGGYAPTGKSLDVVENKVTRADFALDAGRLTVTPGAVTSELEWASTARRTVTFTNDGKAPVRVDLSENEGGSSVRSVGGGEVKTVPSTVDLRAVASDIGASAKLIDAARGAPPDPVSADAPWQTLPAYPRYLAFNLAASHRGKVYSVGGVCAASSGGDSCGNTGFAYDPTSQQWTRLPDLPHGRQRAAGDFINGKLYVAGGWGQGPVKAVDVYDPAANRWTNAAEIPSAYFGSGHAVTRGKLYVVGGCVPGLCAQSDAYSYDPGRNAWTRIADYPHPGGVSYPSCGGIDGKMYCAGGYHEGENLKANYVYDPDTNAWTQIGDMPESLYAGYAAVANGQLVVSGGANSSFGRTNAGYAYDPKQNTWTSVPSAGYLLIHGGAACGFYRVGGLMAGTGSEPVQPLPVVERLPGYDQCDDGQPDAPWLSVSQSAFTVEPGRSVAVKVTIDSRVPSITQPGVFTASLGVRTDTPYEVPPIPVTMNLKPAKGWGKIAGTVYGPDHNGTMAPLAGATVQIEGSAGSYTLTTDAEGHYGLWLDTRKNPVTVIISRSGYQSKAKKVWLVRGRTVTVNVTLQRA